MKKIFALFMIASLLCLTAFAAPAQGLMLTLAQADAAPGTPVDVTLTVSGNPGLAACYVLVSFNTAELRLTDVNGNGVFEGFMSEEKTGGIVLSWEGSLTGNGTVATLTFCPIKASVQSTVTVTPYLNGFVDQTVTVVNGTCQNGCVNVAAAAKGDVTGNGSIDADDVTALARHLAHVALLPAEADGDMNDDGLYNSVDLTALAKQAANII